MPLHSFYEESTPEPSDDETEEHRQSDHIEQTDYRSMIETYGNIFGAPVISPRFLQTASDRVADLCSTLKPFEYEYEKLQEQERSRRNSGHSSSIDVDTASHVPEFTVGDAASGASKKSTPRAGPMDLPVELWDIIFCFVVPNADDDSYQRLGNLFSCALTCRVCSPRLCTHLFDRYGERLMPARRIPYSFANSQDDVPQAWSYLALPVLYRTHGYGVFMPTPASMFPNSAACYSVLTKMLSTRCCTK